MEDEQIFWAWFVENEAAFFQLVKKEEKVQEVVLAEISDKINEIDRDFGVLTGMSDDDTAELVFTADGEIKDFVFVEELVRLAPKLKNWQITAFKTPPDESFEINSIGYSFNVDNLWFYEDYDDAFPDEISLVVVYEGFREEDEDEITNGIYVFIDSYIGEINFATKIDSIIVIGKENTKKELVPISKLANFLNWREKEFIEKYEFVSYNTQEEEYSTLRAEDYSHNPLLVVINTHLLEWELKASHQWFMTVTIEYDGEKYNGLPPLHLAEMFEEVEEDIKADLKSADGYIDLGRMTGGNERNIYFACKEYRHSSKILYQICKKYRSKIAIDYEIIKDKYWKTVDDFRESIF